MKKAHQQTMLTLLKVHLDPQSWRSLFWIAFDSTSSSICAFVRWVERILKVTNIILDPLTFSLGYIFIEADKRIQ